MSKPFQGLAQDRFEDLLDALHILSVCRIQVTDPEGIGLLESVGGHIIGIINGNGYVDSCKYPYLTRTESGEWIPEK